MSQFVPAMLAGRKPHTIRALRKDGKLPKVGTPFAAYYGQRNKQCAWLFDSTIEKVQLIRIEAVPAKTHAILPPIPYIRLASEGDTDPDWSHVPILALDKTKALITADGFDYYSGFREHFLPTNTGHFLGTIIHWDPCDAITQASRHACRDCSTRLIWLSALGCFICACPGKTPRRHHPKREEKPKHPKKAAERTCTRFGCNRPPLIHLKKGDSRQTNNGFLIAKVPGYYCPTCAASYGNYGE